MFILQQAFYERWKTIGLKHVPKIGEIETKEIKPDMNLYGESSDVAAVISLNSKIASSRALLSLDGALSTAPMGTGTIAADNLTPTGLNGARGSRGGNVELGLLHQNASASELKDGDNAIAIGNNTPGNEVDHLEHHAINHAIAQNQIENKKSKQQNINHNINAGALSHDQSQSGADGFVAQMNGFVYILDTSQGKSNWNKIGSPQNCAISMFGKTLKHPKGMMTLTNVQAAGMNVVTHVFNLDGTVLQSKASNAWRLTVKQPNGGLATLAVRLQDEKDSILFENVYKFIGESSIDQPLKQQRVMGNVQQGSSVRILADAKQTPNGGENRDFVGEIFLGTQGTVSTDASVSEGV